jgi:hypothetical protein
MVAADNPGWVMDAMNVGDRDMAEMRRCRYQTSEQEFRQLTDDQLIHCLDTMARTGGGPHHEVADYRNELTRHGTERQNQRLEELTRRLFWLTVWLAILTALLLGIEVLHLLRGE